MDLDFSFTLVSSLTPRSKLLGTPQTENKHSSRSLRTVREKKFGNLPQCYRSDKENHSPEDQLMNNNESYQYNESFTRKSSRSNTSKESKDEISLNIDLANIAVRRNRFKDRRKAETNSSPLQCSDNRLTHAVSSSELNSKPLCNNGVNKTNNLNACTLKFYNNDSNTNTSKKKGVKRKSPQLSDSYSALSCPDFIEDTVPDENVSAHKKVVFSPNPIAKSILQTSGNSALNDYSISPAYSSDFSVRTCRKGAKVIPETPETDNSLTEIGKYKGKTSVSIPNSTDKSKLILKPPNTNVSRKSGPDCTIQSKIVKPPKNEKNGTGNTKQKDQDAILKKDRYKSESSPVINRSKGEELVSSKDSPYNKYTEDNTSTMISTTFQSKTAIRTQQIPKKGNKSKSKQKLNSCSPKGSLIPPSEVIPKFEHITNWLLSTEQNSVLPLSGKDSFEGHSPILIPRKQVSLSPRIKRKMKKAISSLEEEQKLFQELYGDDRTKGLSDDADEVSSLSRYNESVELSEKVLEKLYGTVWQKNIVLPQSEPKNRKIQKNRSKAKEPQTERKKLRTSIYDVFSSSSSEDRFEEFLENVRRGKIESKQQKNDPSPPDFINDSDSESNSSLVFYQNIVSSDVKHDVNKLKDELHEYDKKPGKLNRKRLSFSSSKDDGSESNAIGTTKGSKRDQKPQKDNKGRKGRTKKKGNIRLEDDFSESGNCFNLVTPIKISDKKDDKSNVKLEKILDPIVSKVIGKPLTPKSTKRTNKETNTEKKLKEKDFKVPKALSSLQTPISSDKKSCPSSPALSFLSSLSEVTAGLPCHPDARVFKNDFKNKKEELSKKLFVLYNKEVFENKLPADMLIEWNSRMTSTSGYCYNKRIYRNNQIFRSSRIVLSTKILDRADRLRDTLIHELCHAATWIVNETSDGHGPKWRAWADKANRRFPELPVIKRCHDYAISTKYTYKCMSCGYCIGRHSKSLDTDRKRCGFCYGKFQVFVTAKMASASVTSGSDSIKAPRNPTGFALFVKENYATVKKENNIPHGQVMKLLSQKFAELKIAKTTET